MDRTDRNKTCLVGFDGYVDELYTVVENRYDPRTFQRYETIETFGRRIVDAAGKSADIEISPDRVKFGGNGPILANALAALSYQTTCIGQMDVDQGENPFEKMEPGCERISTGKASRTIALEFSDGKIMLGNLLGSDLTWDKIKEKVGEESLKKKIRASSLLAFVNWSGMYRMNEILGGIYSEILLPISEREGEKKQIFLDLSDPTSRTKEEVVVLFDRIKELAAAARVTLGMNQNEAEKIGRYLGQVLGRTAEKRDSVSQMMEAGEQILSQLNLYQVVIHTNQGAYGFRQGQRETYQGMYVAEPVQTTGAGDHFNAGICMSILEDQELKESLITGQAAASYYVEKGKTADRQELIAYRAEKLGT